MSIDRDMEIEGLHEIIDGLEQQIEFHIANHELLTLGMKAQKMLHDRLLLDYEDAVNHNEELLIAAGGDVEGDEVVH